MSRADQHRKEMEQYRKKQAAAQTAAENKRSAAQMLKDKAEEQRKKLQQESQKRLNRVKRAGTAASPSPAPKADAGLARLWQDKAAEMSSRLREESAERMEALIGRNSAERKPYDAGITQESVLKNPRTAELLTKKREDMAPAELVEMVDIFRRGQTIADMQAEAGSPLADYAPMQELPGRSLGETNRNRQKTLNSGAKLFGMNDATNKNIAEYMRDFSRKAGEEDYRSAIRYLEDRAGEAGKGRYFARVSQDLDALRKEAESRFSGILNDKIDGISREIAGINSAMKESGITQAQRVRVENALNNMDPVMAVRNDRELRELLGYDEIAARYAGDDDAIFEAVITGAYDIIDASGEDRATEDFRRERMMAERDALQAEMDAQIKKRDQILTVEKYTRMLEDGNWADMMAGYFTADTYQPIRRSTIETDGMGTTETRAAFVDPGFDQIIADPEDVQGKYADMVKSGHLGGELSQMIDLATYMDEADRKNIQAVYRSKGEDAAREYFEDVLSPKLLRAQTEELNAAMEEYAREHPVLANVAHAGTSLLSDIENAANTVRVMAGADPIEQRQWTGVTDAIESTSIQMAEDALPFLTISTPSGDISIPAAVLSGWYSLEEQARNRLLFGAAGPLMMGVGQGSREALDTYAETGNRGQALATGASTAGAEAFSEWLGGKLFDTPGKLDTKGDYMKYLARAGLGEGLEETISLVGSTGGRELIGAITGEDTPIRERYAYLTMNGYSPKETREMLAKEFGIEAANNFLGGFFGGEIMGGTVAVNNAISQNMEDRSTGRAIIENGNLGALLQEAAQLAKDKKNKSIRALQERLLKKYENAVVNDAPMTDPETIAETQVLAEMVGMDTQGRVAQPAVMSEADLARQQANNAGRTEETMRDPVARRATEPAVMSEADQARQQENNRERTEASMRDPVARRAAEPAVMSEADQARQQEINRERTEETMRDPAARAAEPAVMTEADLARQQENNRERTEETMRDPTARRAEPAAMSEADLARQQANNSARTEATMREPARQKASDADIAKAFKGESAKVGKLYRRVMDALDIDYVDKARAEIAGQIRNTLQRYGERQIDEVTDAMAAAAMGDELSRDQMDLIEAASTREGVVNDVVKSVLSVDMSAEARELADRRNRMMIATMERIGEDKAKIEAARSRMQEIKKRVAVSGSGETSIINEAGESIRARLMEVKRGAEGMLAVVETDEGEITLPIEQVEAANDGEATLYSYAAGMSDADAANAMIADYDGGDASRYAFDFEAAYNYAKAGLDQRHMQGSSLKRSQMEDAFAAGAKAAQEAAQASANASTSGGKFTLEDGVKAMKDRLNRNQKAFMDWAEKLAKTGVINIRMFASEADADGSLMAYENGSYDAATNTMAIDINAGKNHVNDLAEFALGRVASHELTHYMRAQNPEGYGEYANFIADYLQRERPGSLDNFIYAKMNQNPALDFDAALEEVIADGSEMMLRDSTALQEFAQRNPTVFERIREWIAEFAAKIRDAFAGVYETHAEATALKGAEGLMQKWDSAFLRAMENVRAAQEGAITAPVSTREQQRIDADQAVDGTTEIKNSIRNNDAFMQAAENMNRKSGLVSDAVMAKARQMRQRIYDIFTDPGNTEKLALPPDIEGETFIPDSSYGGSEENTTVCIRSMAAQALMDIIAQDLGKPLTVQDTLMISQEIAGRVDRPECYYCYVATDRRAYREFLGDYIRQRDEVIAEYKNGANARELYKEFLGKRKPTENMERRFDMWMRTVDEGGKLITGEDLASLEAVFSETDSMQQRIKDAIAEETGARIKNITVTMGEIRYKIGRAKKTISLREFAGEHPDMAQEVLRYEQLADAAAYAQSASWAKKMKGYAAYNNHILGWSHERINDLNKHYGLRMYSFSDYSPAFVLENMQMVTDAAVRGLKVLGYTKEMDFAEIFAPSGMNINISCFAGLEGDKVVQDYKQGAHWERAKALRDKYPNVGIVMVASNDRILDWAMQQDWVDVVIPYHLVRTGEKVAEYFGYKNYTKVSADGKGLDFEKSKDAVTSISPVEHGNDIIKYVDALKKHNLTPRFADRLKGLDDYYSGKISPEEFRAMNPNYMKLVNETRRSYADTEAVQPVFDLAAAENSIAQMEREGGYYQPVGGSIEEQYRIAGEIADTIRSGNGIKFSPRVMTPSNRELLYNAGYEVAWNDNQRTAVEIFRENVDLLTREQQQLRELQAQIRERTKATLPEDRKNRDYIIAQQQDRNRAKILKDKIEVQETKIVKLMEGKTLSEIRERISMDRAAEIIRGDALNQYRAGREKTEYRQKIRTMLDNFNKKLKNPTGSKYIPRDMVQMVVAASELVNVENKRTTQKGKEKLAQIQAMYERYKGDSQFAYVYDPVINDMINDVRESVGDRSIYELNSKDLRKIYDMMRAITHQVSNSMRMQTGKDNAIIFDVGREMYQETLEAPAPKRMGISNFINWQLTPDSFFDRMAGFKKDSQWSRIADMFADGTRKYYEIQRDAYRHFRKFTESKEFGKLNSIREKDMVDIGLQDKDGKAIKITRGMMLSAYMHLSSEDNRRAFLFGGFSVPNMKAYYHGNVSGAYGHGSKNSYGTAAQLEAIREKMYAENTTDEEFAALKKKADKLVAQGEMQIDAMIKGMEGMMTDWEKGLVQAAHEWNDGRSRDLINQVTMDLYGIKRAGVKNYYPIHRDPSFIKTDFASISKNMNLENWGSLKDRVNSQAPMLLTDIAFEMDNATEKMARYVAYVKPQIDFTKIYNIRMPGMSGSVEKAVVTKFGTGKTKAGVTAAQYIENLIGDITGSRRSERSFMSALRGNMVRSSMVMNARVAVSQLSAIPKAAVEVGWGPTIKGMAASFGKGAKTANREMISDESPWFWLRWRGHGGMQEFADARGGSGFVDRLYRKAADTRIGRMLTNWNQQVDVAVTSGMYYAAEDWVKHNTELAPGSAEFKKAVSDKYEDILRRTQAASTVTERSDLARTKSEGLSILTMYKSEPFANFNILYDAVKTQRKMKADYKAGINSVTREDVRRANTRLTNAVVSVVFVSSALNALLRLGVNAAMHMMNGYRDEDEEITWESVGKSIANEVIGDAVGMIAGAGEIYDVIAPKFFDEHYYGLNDMALAELDGMLTDFYRVWSKEGSTPEDWKKAGLDMAESASKLMGIPYTTVQRQVEGMWNWVIEARDKLPAYEGGVHRSNGTNYRRLLNASVEGDAEKIALVLAELERNGVEPKTIESGYRSKLKDAYLNGDIDEKQTQKLLIDYGGKDANEAYWLMDEWGYAGEDYSKYGDLDEALIDGNDKKIAAAIKEQRDHGTSDKSIMSHITSEYNDGTITNNAALETYIELSYADDDTYGAFLIATVNGEDLDAHVKAMRKAGKTTSNIMTAINKAFGYGSNAHRFAKLQAFNPADAAIMEERILDAYEAIGMDREEEREWIYENWIRRYEDGKNE